MPLVDHKVLERIYSDVASAHGASAEEAAVFASCLVRADLRGYTRQGAALLPYYDELLREGKMSFGIEPEIEREGPAFAVVDGRFGVGQVIAQRAVAIACEKAGAAGVGLVTMRNAGDFAAASVHALHAVDRGMLGIAMTTGAAIVAPWGGRDPVFCTNPIAFAVPRAAGGPVVIDAATSAYSLGQLVYAARDGRRMENLAVVDREGRYSDDPAVIVEDPLNRESPISGALLPGGPKGYGWLLIVEILSAVLSGHYDAAAGDGPAGGTQAEPRFAQCFIAIDVERLLGPDRFRADMDRLVGVLESVRPAAGFDAVRVPGSRADAEERKRRAEGVPLRDEDWELVRSTWAAHGFGPLA